MSHNVKKFPFKNKAKISVCSLTPDGISSRGKIPNLDQLCFLKHSVFLKRI